MSYEVIYKNAEVLPKYWPLTTFTSRNPLQGFEKYPFKEALQKAKELFQARVYMEPSYYAELYQKGIIRKDVLEKNIKAFLEKNGFDVSYHDVRKFMTDISPYFDKYSCQKLNSPDMNKSFYLLDEIKKDHDFDNFDKLFNKLITKYIFSEILDIVFEQNIFEIFFNDVIEFVSRFLDEGQTTIPIPFREKGMWECFRLNFGIDKTKEEILQDFKNTIRPEDLDRYIQNLFVRFFGFSSFIKYRESSLFYAYQDEYPASLEDFTCILLLKEKGYITRYNKHSVKNFEDLYSFYNQKPHYVILKLLAFEKSLYLEHIHKFLHSKDYETILKDFVEKFSLNELSKILYAKENVFRGVEEQAVYNLIKSLKQEEGYIWTKSLEESYVYNLSKEFVQDYDLNIPNVKANAVFCVDVRSETLRRNLERVDNYKTFGVAGFFGAKLAFIEFDKAHETLLCPPMEKPDRVVIELPKESTKAYETQKSLSKSYKKVWEKLKNNPYTPFFTVESFGWLFGYNLFGKTFFPLLIAKLNKKLKPKNPSTFYSMDKLSEEEVTYYTDKFILEKLEDIAKKEKLPKSPKELLKDIKNKTLDTISKDILSKYGIKNGYYDFIHNKFQNIGFSIEEQAQLAEKFLRLIGMVNNFPEFVLLVGHGSLSDNNPFESALDCGACGGNSGYHNVKAVSHLLNKQEVRDRLNTKIPKDTIFIPAIHNTTIDEVEFYDEDPIPLSKAQKWQEIKNDFKKASSKTRLERASTLPYVEREDDIIIRAYDWSEVRPEWGLSKNIGVWVGKREKAMNAVLSNRFFMHSYDYTIDHDNGILKTILNGPFLIGQWINMEYYFSTVDNEKFGAGSKVYHNVVGKIGVFSGNYSNLRMGLPYQTVYYEDKPYHEPARLLVFVEAPLQKVLDAATQTELPMMLIGNEWVRVIVVDPEQKKVFLFDSGAFVEV